MGAILAQGCSSKLDKSPDYIQPTFVPTAIVEDLTGSTRLPTFKAPTPVLTESPAKPRLGFFAYLPLVSKRWNTLISHLSSSEREFTSYSAVTGELKKWHPLTISFFGPFASETDEQPNPFLDYRLLVTFVGPDSQVYNVPGFFAGDGQGHGEGNIWQVRFAPDEEGLWQYYASFRKGPEVAISLDPDSGNPSSFDGTVGAFLVGELAPEAPGFLRWGRLEYVHDHYLKFRDGSYWLKGGTDSPENFLGYRGFDNTIDQGGNIPNFLHSYSPHIVDWQQGDPDFTSIDSGYDARGIIGALNYLSNHHVNSIYLLLMNLGGDGQDTYPFVGTSGSHFDNTHYDISKLDQWNIVFEHAQRRGIALHMVLNETEAANRQWLDAGELGVERKLFYREMVARFGYLLALKWNLSEENVFHVEQLHEFANYIQALDWAQHPLAFHTPSNYFADYDQVVGDYQFTVTSIQYNGELAGNYVETWRKRSFASGWPWVIDMDENNPAGIGLTPWNTDELRKQMLYDVYFSGGNIEWYAGYHDLPIGGDLRLEDFRTREPMWEQMWYARNFMQENLPFWEISPRDDLLIGESEKHGGGEVLAKDGIIYAIFLPETTPGVQLTVGNTAEAYSLKWFNPRTGHFEGTPIMAIVNESRLDLGMPPSEIGADWVVLVTSLEFDSVPPFNPYP